MKSMILAAVCAAALVAGAADEKQPETKMTARLVDGSTLVGTPKFETLKVKLAFAESKIPVGLVSSLDFTSKSVKVTFTNTDVLTGEPQFDELAVKASFGDVDLKIVNLRGVTFLKAMATGGDWMSFRTGDLQDVATMRTTWGGKIGAFLADSDSQLLWNSLPCTIVSTRGQYRYAYKGSRGYRDGDPMSVWAVFNRTTGRLIAVWAPGKDGRVNAIALILQKNGRIWRGTGMTLLNNPTTFAVNEEGTAMTMKWGSVVEGVGTEYVLVRWNANTDSGSEFED